MKKAKKDKKKTGKKNTKKKYFTPSEQSERGIFFGKVLQSKG